MMSVRARNGFYQIVVTGARGIDSYFVHNVNGSVECTCGKEGCDHVEVVKKYVAMGGQPPRRVRPERVRMELAMRQCPICGSQTVDEPGATWRCVSGGGAHYFEWLNEQYGDKIRKWMCGEGKEAWLRTIGDRD